MLIPAALVAAHLYVSAEPGISSAYALAAQNEALGAAALVQPLTGLIACVSGARLRASGILRGQNRRSVLAVFGLHVAPVALSSWLALTATTVLTSAQWVGSFAFDMRLLVLAMLQCAAYAGLGFSLGFVARPVVAVPLALITPYLVIAFPPAMEPYWIRHLTWIAGSCCQIYEDYAPRAVAANALTSLAILFAGLTLFNVMSMSALRARIISAALAIVCAASAVLAASPLEVAAVVARSGGLRCEDAAGVRVCVWPEHESNRALAAALVTQAVGVARATGAPMPKTVTERDSRTLRWPEVSTELSPDIDAATLKAGMASSMSPEVPCSIDGVASDDPLAGKTAVTLWWARQLRVQAPAADKHVADAVKELSTLPPREQGAKIAAWVDALTRCEAAQ